METYRIIFLCGGACLFAAGFVIGAVLVHWHHMAGRGPTEAETARFVRELKKREL